MTVYNINLGIGWASSGVEYAQAYRSTIFKNTGIKAKFVFMDMFLQDNLSDLARNMGFSDEDFNKAEAAGISNSQLYKQAGNSIVVDVLYHIYKELYKVMPYLFDNLKLCSCFSGIGAFESGLDRLYIDINTGKI